MLQKNQRNHKKLVFKLLNDALSQNNTGTPTKIGPLECIFLPVKNGVFDYSEDIWSIAGVLVVHNAFSFINISQFLLYKPQKFNFTILW